jgi:hypothetical protein
MRFKDAPAVTTAVVQRADQPSTGSGEPASAPIAAAIAKCSSTPPVFASLGADDAGDRPLCPGGGRVAGAEAGCG